MTGSGIPALNFSGSGLYKRAGSQKRAMLQLGKPLVKASRYPVEYRGDTNDAEFELQALRLKI